MNCRKIYQQLVGRAKFRKLTREDCYVECHHIVPRAEGGSDENDNLVNLTAREHFIAHLLLAKIYNDLPMYYAVVMMANGLKSKRKLKINSRLYAAFRIERNKKMKGIVAYNKGVHGIFHWFTDGNTEVLAKTCPHGFRKGRVAMTSAQKQKLRQANVGKHHNDESRLKMSISRKGHIPWCKGMAGKMPKKFIETMSRVCSGSGNPMFGKIGKDNPNYGKHWFNNGSVNVFAFECPNGFTAGKVKGNNVKTIDS